MCIKHLQMDSGAKNSLVLRVTMTNEDTIWTSRATNGPDVASCSRTSGAAHIKSLGRINGVLWTWDVFTPKLYPLSMRRALHTGWSPTKQLLPPRNRKSMCAPAGDNWIGPRGQSCSSRILLWMPRAAQETLDRSWACVMNGAISSPTHYARLIITCF